MSNHSMVGPFLLVISAGVKQNSSDVFNIIDSDTGGSKTFSVALQQISDPTKKFWGAYTMLEDRTHAALLSTVTSFKTFVDAMAVEKGRTPVGSITAFKGSLQISEANVNPWEQLAAWGYEQVPSAV